MEREFDLAQIAENLAEEIPEVQKLYLFGSRLHGTRSLRSDVDILVVHSGYIKPKKLRDFSERHCKALDLFLVDEAKAVSSQNESYVEATTFDALLRILHAIPFWSREEGRLSASIQWRFKVREDVEFIPTALPDALLQRSDEEKTDIEKLTIGELVRGLTVKQFWGVLAALGVLLSAVFGAGIWVGSHSRPLEKRPPSSIVQPLEHAGESTGKNDQGLPNKLIQPAP